MKFLSPMALAAVAAATVPTWVWAQAPSDPERYGYGPHMMWWGGGYGMIFGPLIMILLLVLVIVAVVLLVRWAGGPWPGTQSQSAPQRTTALDILKERFARGEIDKNEYEERRRILGD